MGSLAMPTRTRTAPAHYHEEKTQIIQAWKDKALKDGFAAGPYSRKDIETTVGPFVGVPIMIVHTPATATKAEKNRVCFNASWSPYGDTAEDGIRSINEEVKWETWECEWFLVCEVKVLLSSASANAHAMGFDLADAYQQVPNHPTQRQRFVIAVGEEFFVWLVGMFGIATMAAIFGQLCDVLCAWLEHCFPDIHARHFADDHLMLFDGTDARPTEAEVYEVVHWFGWKVHATKRFGWSRRFTLLMLGFEWDMDAGMVWITAEKRGKYVSKLNDLLGRKTVRYKDTASAIGTLVHVCGIFPERRAKLQALYAMRARFHRPNPHHALEFSSSAVRELQDWLAFLLPEERRATFRLPADSFPWVFFSDASDKGCGIVVEGKAQGWELPGMIAQQGVDIGVMEAWALELALLASIEMGARECVVRFRVDNLGVVWAIRKGRSRSRWTNHCLDRIAERAMQANVIMSVEYVASAENLADGPSRGDCSQFDPLNFNLAAPWQEFLGAACK
ncbi:hypothetical protein CF319_g8546 [Tilletia indica]|nr:hypothetical protein CF319_g8546 [Tilletia indica]